MKNKIINILEDLSILLLALALLVHIHADSLKHAELEAQFENEINQVRFETQAHIEKLEERIKELENQATQETAFSADLSHEKIRGIISLGNFKLTAYCPCVACCGKSDGITSTGVKAQANRTIAVDPKIIPYGTVVEIGGREYVAEDCGGAIKGNRIDVYFDNHAEALNFGVQHKEVFKVV